MVIKMITHHKNHKLFILINYGEDDVYVLSAFIVRSNNESIARRRACDEFAVFLKRYNSEPIKYENTQTLSDNLYESNIEGLEVKEVYEWGS